MARPARDLIVPPPTRADADQCVVLRGVSWQQYEGLLAARGDDAKPRFTFLKGTLWIMSPSKEHDSTSRMFDKLLTAYAEEVGLDLRAFGAWTLKGAPERGAEADESYVLGEQPREVPQLVVEVVWGSELGGKLDVYRGLGVPEVWVWQRGQIEVHVLRRGRYELVTQSVLLPGLDLALVARLVTRADQIAAIRELRASLRRR